MVPDVGASLVQAALAGGASENAAAAASAKLQARDMGLSSYRAACFRGPSGLAMGMGDLKAGFGHGYVCSFMLPLFWIQGVPFGYL